MIKQLWRKRNKPKLRRERSLMRNKMLRTIWRLHWRRYRPKWILIKHKGKKRQHKRPPKRLLNKQGRNIHLVKQLLIRHYKIVGSSLEKAFTMYQSSYQGILEAVWQYQNQQELGRMLLPRSIKWVIPRMPEVKLNNT